MNVIKCDRCGNYIDSTNVPAIRGWKSDADRMVGTPEIRMDLCPACYDALEEFLLIKKENKDG